MAGLPEPRKDHALVMARFANDCLNKMMKLVELLEVSLGPDTADLSYVQEATIKGSSFVLSLTFASLVPQQTSCWSP